MLYFLWYDLSNPPRSLTLRGVLWWMLTVVLWVVCVVASILFKETGITLLAIILGSSVLALLTRALRVLVKSRSNSSSRATIVTAPTSGEGVLDAKIEKKQSELHTMGSCDQTSKYVTSSWLWNHIAWIVLCVLVILAYFVFRAVLVASPDSGTSLSSLLRAPSPGKTSLPARLQNLLSVVGDTVSMLLRLVLGPLVPSLREAKAASTSSFYLDESQLIRKAENPFAFLDPAEKAMSLMYLHFRYFFLLLWPRELCAEYAFDCIPKVSSWEDNGNYRLVYPLVMYAALMVAVLRGVYRLVFPLPVPVAEGGADDVGVRDDDPPATLTAILLLVVPFVPASGVRHMQCATRCSACYSLTICVGLMMCLLWSGVSSTWHAAGRETSVYSFYR
jgi:hypothetical protein